MGEKAKLVKAIESEEEWDEWIAKSENMLLVLDCHQDWCGPCDTLQPTFAGINNDVAESETRLSFLSVSFQPFCLVLPN